MNFNIVRLAKSNILNLFACWLYKKFNIDFTYPINLYIEITHKCNSRCKMCGIWKSKKITELPSSQWIKIIKEIKNINRDIKVNFAGGEALLKNDFFEILNFCKKEKIIFGLTTNGKLLKKENIKKFLSFNPFNLNISLDSLNDKTYYEIRGVPYLNEIKSNIYNLLQYKKEIKSDTIINLKTIVCSKNLKELKKIAIFARENQFAGITFQPVVKTVNNIDDLFNIDKSALKDEIENLLELKKNGYKINNSKKNLSQWINYFENKLRNPYCFVPITNYYFSPGGDVRFCDYDQHILGNIKYNSFLSMINSKRNKKIKKELIYCSKSCVYCVQRDLSDYYNLFLNYITQKS